MSPEFEYAPFGSYSRHDKYGDDADVAWYYFTGKEKDDETGLFYFGARYYDPSLGRFITPDTIIEAPYNPQSLNRYSYVQNNPINRIDPSGHWSFKKFFKSFVSAFVGAAITVVTLGAGAPLAIAMMAGGAAGGFIGGGWTDQGWSWKGALIGAGIGGVTGFAMGGGLGPIGVVAAWGVTLGGAGYTIATQGTDGLSSVLGAITGGVAGGAAGVAISKATNPNSIFNAKTVDSNNPQVQDAKARSSLETDSKPKVSPDSGRKPPIRVMGKDGKVEGIIMDGKYYPAKYGETPQIVARVHDGPGGRAQQLGHSWTPEDPFSADFISKMGVPGVPHNSQARVSIGVLRANAPYIERAALPNPFTGAGGGGREYGVLNPYDDITIIWEGPYKP